MYLEISARQTGKTKRLVEHMIKTLESGVPEVVLFTKHRFPLISYPQLAVYEDRVIRFTDSHNYNRYALGKRTSPPIYYDEFDIQESVLIREKGYYVTTPTRLRTVEDMLRHFIQPKDTLLSLIDANKGEYVVVTILGSGLGLGKVLEMYKQLDKETFSTEIGGSYLDF